MIRKHTLLLLIERAAAAKNEALQKNVQAKLVQARELEKQQLLRRYQHDYIANMRSLHASAVSARHLMSTHGLVSKLDVAINAQTGVITQATQAVAESASLALDRDRSLERLRLILDRQHQIESTKAARYEQKTTDEFANLAAMRNSLP
jgi:flagellar protein FliJ